MTLQIRETYVNETTHGQFGELDWYEPFTDDRGKLFRALQREYGRCGSKIYVDRPGGAVQVGWYFLKRMKYEDARSAADTYVRGVWVEYRQVVEDDSAL